MNMCKVLSAVPGLQYALGLVITVQRLPEVEMLMHS